MWTKETIIRQTIFGDDLHPISITALSQKTGIPRSTLYAYRDSPMRIPLDNLLAIWSATERTGEDFQKLVGCK